MNVYSEVSVTESKVNSSSRCHWIVALGGWDTLLGSKACWTKWVWRVPCSHALSLFTYGALRYVWGFLTISPQIFSFTFFNKKPDVQRHEPLQEQRGGRSGVRRFHLSRLLIWKHSSPSSKGLITMTPKMCDASMPWKIKPQWRQPLLCT